MAKISLKELLYLASIYHHQVELYEVSQFFCYVQAHHPFFQCPDKYRLLESKRLQTKYARRRLAKFNNG